MQTELLPCPFCGNAKPNIAIGETVDIICWNCGCNHPLHENVEYAIEAWNNRVEFSEDGTVTITSESYAEICDLLKHPAYDETKWQLVPREPTEEMKLAASKFHAERWAQNRTISNSDIYFSMLEAAPKHQSKGSEE